MNINDLYTLGILLVTAGIVYALVHHDWEDFSVKDFLSNLVGFIIGVYVVLCILATVGIFFVSPFLLWEWIVH